jgi:hypothetical protein
LLPACRFSLLRSFLLWSGFLEAFITPGLRLRAGAIPIVLLPWLCPPRLVLSFPLRRGWRSLL